jgi:hypothetical protein
MVRTGDVVLGIGLVILWIAGLSAHATGWLTWLDGLAALGAFAIGGAVATRTGAAAGTATIALSLGLFVLWIVALATDASLWLSWCTFAFALALLILGIAGTVSTRAQLPRVAGPRIPRAV